MNEYLVSAAFIVVVIVLVIIMIIRDNKQRAKDSTTGFAAQRNEQARKQAAFDAWYASLEAHEQYMVDQKLAQGQAMRGIAAGMLANNMHDFME